VLYLLGAVFNDAFRVRYLIGKSYKSTHWSTLGETLAEARVPPKPPS
jgi:hypothetical protein